MAASAPQSVYTGARKVPFTARTFASRHNKKLKGSVASKAAAQANAMMKAGVPEGEAIATANKHAAKTMGLNTIASGKRGRKGR